MSKLFYPLFFLPIHRHTRTQYYKEEKENIEKQKREFEKNSPVPFDRIGHEDQRWWLNKWSYPPWKFNDIVGYLDIGINIGNDLTAEIYLRRKNLSRSDSRKKGGTTLKNNEFLYFCEVIKIPIRDRDNNEDYVQALKKILLETKKILKNNRKYVIWTPFFNFSCFNFVEACKQIKKQR
ncbi:MAG: hypothetical protein ACOC5F_06580 [Candidatus Aminicenantaceae bacterium]